jgi:hypothetical protein
MSRRRTDPSCHATRFFHWQEAATRELCSCSLDPPKPRQDNARSQEKTSSAVVPRHRLSTPPPGRKKAAVADSPEAPSYERRAEVFPPSECWRDQCRRQLNDALIGAHAKPGNSVACHSGEAAGEHSDAECKLILSSICLFDAYTRRTSAWRSSRLRLAARSSCHRPRRR